MVVVDIADLYDPRPSPWFTDPCSWVESFLDEFLWSKQREVLDSVRDHRRTAVHSGFGIGKSWVAAHAVAWWCQNGTAGDTLAVTTAPTGEQVRSILWRYIREVHRRGRLRGRTNQREWWLGDQLVGFGRSPADTNPEAFQGHHADRLLAVIDETAGVAPAILDTVEGLVTTDESRILAIGNPDAAGSAFGNICKPGSGWNVIHIDVLDSPNFTGEAVPESVARALPGPVWVEEKRQTWGEASPLWISKVRGQFPEDADDGVVRASKVAECRRPHEPPWAGKDLEPVELGVDVGAGGDYTAIRERCGRKAGRVWHDHTSDSEQVVGKVVHAIKETGAGRVKVDTIGIGWGVVGHLRSLRKEHGAVIVPVNVSESPRNGEKFAKLRDELWWEVGRELSEDGWWDLSGVDDDTLAQLLAPKYGIDASGRIKVERKEETKKRLGGSSPDDADALLLAFYGRGRAAGSGTSSLGHLPNPLAG